MLYQKKAEEKAKVMGRGGFMNAMSKKILRERSVEQNASSSIT